ncbi:MULTISPECIES: helix-turn-helix domain-containing protein [Bacillaceae]|uniref:Helix-turn-helix domain-containing protein n=1 Tax=Evansella alkalicola TaxID=745819 RepID=A0ABS6JY64_9BACI|nr:MULTISPECIES: helix-turn-helix domain-containing protein [Bacillaceae]MBU9723172.1 helix-turn-helix domain-containing protein [Bacillus alkalicola]
MYKVQKQDELLERIDLHLRTTARQLLRFNTLDETLHYLVDAFSKQLTCDYVSIILKTNERLSIKIKSGEAPRLEQIFPLDENECIPSLFTESFSSDDHLAVQDHCSLFKGIEAENFQTWFTVPIRQDYDEIMGLCVIGFRTHIPLLMDAEKLFEEYGKDIATAIDLAQSKENEINKIKGLEWLKESAYFEGVALEQIVGNIVERAGKGTNSDLAYVYLYDDAANQLVFQTPSYGEVRVPDIIPLEEQYDLKEIFPYFEQPGGSQITIPLVVNLKTIGILQVEKVNHGAQTFTEENMQLLHFLSSHVSALVENARLYKNEKDQKVRLETFMNHQQDLLKQTIEEEGFNRISTYLSSVIGYSVFMFDRFLRPISHCLSDLEETQSDEVFAKVNQEKKSLLKEKSMEYWLALDNYKQFGIWKIVGGGEVLGYMGLIIQKKDVDMVLQMTLNYVLNVYAVQFIKQKLVIDVREQVKDSFISNLFEREIERKEEIIEYATILNWDLFEPHRIGIFSFVIGNGNDEPINLLESEAKKTWIWDYVRDNLSKSEPNIIFTRKENYFIVIVPTELASRQADYWSRLYRKVIKLVKVNSSLVKTYLGVSQTAENLEDYFVCYKQALQALQITCNRFPEKGYLTFDDLGSYTVLYNLNDQTAADLFLKKYLNPLLNYRRERNTDLFNTLRVYLNCKGNIKETSEELYIHRSSLKYRLEKVREVLDIDIDDAEQRFNLMLAYKLYDLHH